MATTQKAIELSAYLAEALALRLSALAQSTSFDTDGNPLISVGSGTAGQKNLIVKVMPTPWPNAKDSLGNSAIQYTPHTVRLATEASAAAGVGTIFSTQDVLHFIGEILGKGCRVEWYQSANGVAPTATTINDSTKLQASFELSLQYPLIQSQ